MLSSAICSIRSIQFKFLDSVGKKYLQSGLRTIQFLEHGLKWVKPKIFKNLSAFGYLHEDICN